MPRSVFTPAERLQQLIEQTLPSIAQTTHGIREQVGVLVFEASVLTEDEQALIEQQLKHLFAWSELRIVGTRPDVAQQRDSLYKGPVELMMLHEYLAQVPASVQYVVKLSGRYHLTAQSNLLDMVKTTNHYGLYKFPGQNPSTTVIFGIPRALFADAQHRLQNTIAVCSHHPISIEDVLFADVQDYFHYQGAAGKVSIDGTTWSI